MQMLSATTFPLSAQQERLLHRTTIATGGIVLLIAAMALTAWHSHSAWLIEHAPWIYQMRYNTALSCALCGMGLLLTVNGRQTLARATSMAVMLIGGATFIQYITPLDTGIDQLFFTDYLHDTIPGRMAPNTALTFLLTGTGLMLTTISQPKRAIDISMELLGSMVFALGAIALVGYLTSSDLAFTWGSKTRMAPHTALAFLFWSFGFMALIWQRQATRIANLPLWLPALLCFCILLFDLATPLGVAAGIAYIPVVFSSLWFIRPHTSFVFAAIATLLTIIGYYVSPAGPYDNWIVLLNRELSISALWCTAALVYMLHQRMLTQRGSENKLRAVVDNVVDGLITIDERGHIESFNPACERIFGYSADEVMGQNIKMLMPEPYRAEHDGYLSHYVSTGNARIIGTAGREVSGKRKNGMVFPMDLSVSAFQLKDGRHFSGIIRDITERKEAEKAQEQLRQIQKIEALGQLTGGIAHDFNNIIAVILGNLDFLQERARDPALQNFIKPSIEAAMHGAELTQRLLAFGRKQSLQPQVISLNDLVTHFSTLVYRTLGERVKIVPALMPDVWPVNVDPGQLEAAILNLSVNARDAMPDGGILTYETKNISLQNVWVTRDMEIPPGDYVMLAVNDTGTGMPPEVIQKAFEPFFTTKGIGKGSGLGLSMVYGFVKQSAGHIHIESEVGRGSSIRIYLPRATGDIVASEKKNETPVPVEKRATIILVVEDNKNVLKLTSEMVESLGYEVIQAENGDSALQILEKRKDIDLLLSDVMLPGTLNGPALARRAVKLLPHLKVLFNSGYAADDIFESGMLEEGAHLISKPFRKRQLAEKIAELLQ